MGFRNRRVRLTNVSLPTDDLLWLNGQGYLSHAQLSPMATWYRPDGTSAQGRTDPYHLHLYRMKGFTLKAPYVRPVKPRKASLPWVASRAQRVLGDRQEWIGTATEFINSLEVAFGYSPDKLGKAIFKANVTASLANVGIEVSRGYKGKAKVLKLKRREIPGISPEHL